MISLKASELPSKAPCSAPRPTPPPPASSRPNLWEPTATAARCSPKSAERADLYRSLRTHGEGKTRYEVLRTGMNGRLDTIQAAVLLAKLAVFPAELQARERIATVYDQRLGNAVTTPMRVADSTSAWSIYAILLRDQPARDRVQATLRANGVPTAIYYPRPLHRQPAYSTQHDGVSLPVAEHLAERILALPIHPDLTDDAVDQICNAVLAAVS